MKAAKAKRRKQQPQEAKAAKQRKTKKNKEKQFKIIMRRIILSAIALLFAVVMSAQNLYVGSYNVRNRNDGDEKTVTCGLHAARLCVT